MNLRRFYGYTGTLSAKTTARIYLFTGIFLYVFGFICMVLIKLHLMSPGKPGIDVEEMEENLREQGFDVPDLIHKKRKR